MADSSKPRTKKKQAASPKEADTAGPAAGAPAQAKAARTAKPRVEPRVEPTPPPEPPRAEPGHEEIRRRAYELWLAHGGAAGDNWLEAERQLRG